MINKLTKSDCRKVAELHITGISTGFISSLGIDFVCAVYEMIVEDNDSFGLVAVEDNDIVGFVAFSENLSKLYKHVILRNGFRFALILARKMLSFSNIKKVLANLLYPNKTRQMNLPEAELLSIVVAEQGRGKGVAQKLVERGLAECTDRGVENVKVLVASNNIVANNLYQKCGFKLAARINSHGTDSNIYVVTLNN